VNSGGCNVGSAQPPNGHFAPWGIENLEPREGDHDLDDRLGEDAANLIRKRDQNQPFLLNFWPCRVHTAIQAKPANIAKHEAKAKAVGLFEIHPIREGERFRTVHAKDRRVRRRAIQSDPVYAAIIERLDDNVDKLLDVLDEQGVAGYTIVVFTSDMGGLATSEGSPPATSRVRWEKAG
jgi:arylsulfatase A-like enzyme